MRHWFTVVAAVVLLSPVAPATAELRASGALLRAEMAANNRLDAGEGVAVAFCVRNPDPTPATPLRLTLQPGNGVESPSGPQFLTSLAPSESGCRTFTFRVGASCGLPVRATLTASTGTGPDVQLIYLLPTGPDLLFADFENVTAPTFPVGFFRATTGGTTGWTTVEGNAASGRNRAFTPSPVGVSTASLTTFAFAVPAGVSRLSFRHQFDTEAGFDGGVLEIAIGGGAFQDILVAGGLFEGGGYNAIVSGLKGSAIGGRQAWSGSSAGYQQTVVRLPAAAAGQNVQLRWRYVTDTTVGGVGWSLDEITAGAADCGAIPQDVPWGHVADVRGNEVTLQWRPPLAGGPAQYVLEASTDLGATFPYVFPMGTSTAFAATAASGQYRTRVRAVQGGVTSAPSLAAVADLGASLGPATPTGFLASAAGTTVTMRWSLDEQGGTPDEIRLLAGSAPGLSDVAVLALPPGTSSLTVANVPAGTYYLRLQPVWLTVPGDPSKTVQLVVPGACNVPAPPPWLRVSRQAGSYLFAWELGAVGTAAPAAWQLQAGTAPGLSDLAVVPLDARTFSVPIPPAGTYYVRAVALNACGASAASNEVTLVVP